jgi:aryl-alcohol dehydrogenase-like predicted oxidoreductase
MKSLNTLFQISETFVNPNKACSRLGIGTVQFGLDYGIANKTGKPDQAVAQNILNIAQTAGVTFIDTSPAYGSSERALGEIIAGSDMDFNIVSKTPAFNLPVITKQDADVITASAEASLRLLGLQQLYGLLFHHGLNVTKSGGEYLISALQELKARDKVKKIGFSAYNNEEIENILNVFTPDIIQIPVNILDQNFINSKLFKDVKAAGIEIHARSIFLQGLLLLDPSDLPTYFNTFKKHLSQLRSWLSERGMSPLEGFISFAFQEKNIDAIVVGVEGVTQIQQIIEAIEKTEKTELDFSKWAINDPAIINPSLWPN